MLVSTDAIRVEGRCRKDLGDIGALASSIADVGLLHPVVVTADMALVAGERRLSAVRQLGWAEVPVTVTDSLPDAAALLRAERDENTARKELAPTEFVALAERLAVLLRPAAEERKAATQLQGRDGFGNPIVGGAKFAPPKTGTGKTRDAVGGAVGISGETLRKAQAVVKAAEEQPEAFGALPDLMDKTGKVDRAYNELRKAQRKAVTAAVGRAEPTPDLVQVVTGDFRTALAALPDASATLVFTDPPYDEGSIPLYADLAREASRVLVDGGSLLTYAGHYAVGDIIANMAPHLRYWWLCGVKHNGPSARLPGKWVFVEWKPILWFVKGGRRDNEFVADMVTSQEVPTKAEHEWQQGTAEATYYIERLTAPGELVVDPFLGSGTTAIAAAKAGRRAWGCEVDGDRADVARGRIVEALR